MNHERLKWYYAPFDAVVSSATIARLDRRVLIVGVVACTFVLRLLYGAHVDLMPEEAYYWNYAQHLDIGYLDHPPLVAWLIRIGTAFFGDTELGIRIPALVCGAIASFFVFRLTRNLYGAPSAFVALLLMQLLPFFFMSGMLMTPDAALTAAWAATLYYLEQALIAGRPSAWAGAGVCFGVGLLAKYSICLLGASALLFLLVDRSSRCWLRRWEPYAAGLIAIAVFSPVLRWNADHGWASFVFQTSRRLAEQPHFSLHKLIGGLIVLITPLGLVGVIAALFAKKSQISAEPAIAARARRLFACC